MTTQLNAAIPTALAKRVKKDVVNVNTTINEYIKQACERFLSLTPAQRKIYFESVKQKKTLGRKINIAEGGK
jgi:hypothetical protein